VVVGGRRRPSVVVADIADIADEADGAGCPTPV
jgi:hypothetical protein